VSAGFDDDDGAVAVQELTPMVAYAETFGEWQRRCEPLDDFTHVGVVQHGYYGGVWCRAVLLQHRLGGTAASLVAQRERGKPRQGVVANTPKLPRNGAVGFIDWLGVIARVLAYDRDQKKNNADHGSIPAQHRTQQAETSRRGEQIANAAPEIQMRSDDRKQAMLIGEAREQHERCEKRKGFEEICRGLIYAIG
jgi:hypothetical protein